MSKTIVLIGNSPVIYMCGVYLHTANLKTAILKTPKSIDFICTIFPGLPGINKQQLLERCEKQVSELGIPVISAKDVNIRKQETTFIVEHNNDTINAWLVLTDDPVQIEDKNIIFTGDFIEDTEAISLAGLGCRLSFLIREMYESE